MSTVCLINTYGAIHEHKNIYTSSIEDHVTKYINESFYKYEIEHSYGFVITIYYRTDDAISPINHLAKYILPQKEIRGSILVAMFNKEGELLNCDKNQLFFIFPAMKWHEYSNCIIS